MNLKYSVLIQFVLIFIFASCGSKKSNNSSTSKLGEVPNNLVKVENNEANKSVDVYFGDDLFTSYIYPDNVMKPCLWPVLTSEGTEITRKYPMKKSRAV